GERSGHGETDAAALPEGAADAERVVAVVAHLALYRDVLVSIDDAVDLLGGGVLTAVVLDRVQRGGPARDAELDAGRGTVAARLRRDGDGQGALRRRRSGVAAGEREN